MLCTHKIYDNIRTGAIGTADAFVDPATFVGINEDDARNYGYNMDVEKLRGDIDHVQAEHMWPVMEFLNRWYTARGCNWLCILENWT